VTSSQNVVPQRDLSRLARPSGGFAMLAVDQREAMRAMFAEHQSTPVTDEQVTAFKLAATRILTPYASAVLLDKQFVLDRAIEEKAVDGTCALIAAADEFIPGADEIVGDVVIDDAVDPAYYRDRGAAALQLLVIYRPDGDPEKRIALVKDFLDRCHAAGLVSIIEPVSRKPLDGREWDWDAGVLAAAEELGSLGADLYKAEMPMHGQGDPDELRRRCARLTETIASPWVILSSGVPHEVFPSAVEIACQEGASGFLAGRAVWASVIGSENVEQELRNVSVPRLQRLAEIVDANVRNGVVRS
jgi:sulfofructosephosphate aldolase